MKHKLSMILTAVILLSVLTGCGTAGKQASTVAESEEETGLTVRIVNQSAVKLYGIAASWSANGETLGSKACDRMEEDADQPIYELCFAPDELPAAPIDAFRAKGMGKKAVRLDALACNAPAHRLYESLGFKKRGVCRWYAENTGWFDFYLFECLL